MSRNDTKHIQTELDAQEYEVFREFARERNMTVKEACREALRRWIDQQRNPDPSDPAFEVLTELDDPSGQKQTDARHEDDLVEEWHGDSSEFTLAEDPTDG